jgi:hypothetical protein
MDKRQYSAAVELGRWTERASQESVQYGNYVLLETKPALYGVKNVAMSLSSESAAAAGVAAAAALLCDHMITRVSLLGRFPFYGGRLARIISSGIRMFGCLTLSL